MKKKRLFIASFLFILVLALGFFIKNGGHHMGKVIDAKVVGEVPTGFVHLSPESIPSYRGGGNWENGMRHVSWEANISFILQILIMSALPFIKRVIVIAISLSGIKVDSMSMKLKS